MVFVWKYKRIIWMSILGIRDSGEKIVTNGLVLHYDAAQFRSYTSGSTTWNDLSGNSNNLTLTNSPGYSGSNGGSIVFDSVNDYVISSNNPNIGNITSTSGYTICTWAYPTLDINQQKQAVIGGVGTGGSQDFNYALLLCHGSFGIGNVYGYGFADASGVVLISQNIWTNNAWNFCCAKVKGTSCELYINGSKVGNTLTINSFINTGSTYKYLVGTGYSHPISVFKFAGNIPITCLYNRNLSDAEILQNYNAQKGRFGL
jgi:hypothetical protein